MFLVGGGILVHGTPALHHVVQRATAGFHGVVGALAPTAVDGLVGLVAGALVLMAFALIQRLRKG
jgi:uncharacterized protein